MITSKISWDKSGKDSKAVAMFSSKLCFHHLILFQQVNHSTAKLSDPPFSCPDLALWKRLLRKVSTFSRWSGLIKLSMISEVLAVSKNSNAVLDDFLFHKLFIFRVDVLALFV